MWNLDGLVITDMSATAHRRPTSTSTPSRDQRHDRRRGPRGAGGRHRINMTTSAARTPSRQRPRVLRTRRPLVGQRTRLDEERPAPAGRRQGRPHQRSATTATTSAAGRQDKLWFYSSYGKQDIRLTRLTQTADRPCCPRTTASSTGR
jgi:hypothetical protein